MKKKTKIIISAVTVFIFLISGFVGYLCGYKIAEDRYSKLISAIEGDSVPAPSAKGIYDSAEFYSTTLPEDGIFDEEQFK